MTNKETKKPSVHKAALRQQDLSPNFPAAGNELLKFLSSSCYPLGHVGSCPMHVHSGVSQGFAGSLQAVTCCTFSLCGSLL